MPMLLFFSFSRRLPYIIDIASHMPPALLPLRHTRISAAFSIRFFPSLFHDIAGAAADGDAVFHYRLPPSIERYFAFSSLIFYAYMLMPSLSPFLSFFLRADFFV